MDGYRFVHPAEVRFRDLDAMGHVNNAVFLTYLESARIAYWLHVTGRAGLSGMDMILARVELDFRSPVAFGERLETGVRCRSIGRTSFELELRIEEREARRLVAEARKVLVYFDYSTGKSRRVPDDLRSRIRAHDPDVRPD